MQGTAVPLETPYSDSIIVMKEMNWSWTDLQEAPADLVDELLVRISARSHWESERDKFKKSMRQ